jgi:hypothetical protein
LKRKGVKENKKSEVRFQNAELKAFALPVFTSAF